jgi:hypothetical protein
MADLEDGPQSLIAFLSLVWGILGILHLVGKLEESVFDVFEAIWWRLSVTGGARWWHSWACVGEVEVVDSRDRSVRDRGWRISCTRQGRLCEKIVGA